MSVIRCENGHFFDNEKYVQCPHCENGNASDAVRRSRKMKELVLNKKSYPQDEKTIGIFKIDNQDPVVGWLVCVQGKEKGRDYRIHAGRNFVGRHYKEDISLPDDERVAGNNHCSIVYEPRSNTFLLVKGEGDYTCINGERLDIQQIVHEDDYIEIGSSLFVFIPFCKGERTWEG